MTDSDKGQDQQDAIKFICPFAGVNPADLTPAQLEAGAQAASEWRSLGGLLYLGYYDLVRRVVAAVAAVDPNTPSSN